MPWNKRIISVFISPICAKSWRKNAAQPAFIITEPAVGYRAVGWE